MSTRKLLVSSNLGVINSLNTRIHVFMVDGKKGYGKKTTSWSPILQNNVTNDYAIYYPTIPDRVTFFIEKLTASEKLLEVEVSIFDKDWFNVADENQG